MTINKCIPRNRSIAIPRNGSFAVPRNRSIADTWLFWQVLLYFLTQKI